MLATAWHQCRQGSVQWFCEMLAAKKQMKTRCCLQGALSLWGDSGTHSSSSCKPAESADTGAGNAVGRSVVRGSQGRLHGRSDMSHRMNRVHRVWWVAALRPGCALPRKAPGPQVRRRLPWVLRCALGCIYLAGSGTALAVLSSDTSGFHLRAHPESSPQPAPQVPRTSGVHEGMRMSPSSEFPCPEVSKLFWGLPTSPHGTSTSSAFCRW